MLCYAVLALLHFVIAVVLLTKIDPRWAHMIHAIVYFGASATYLILFYIYAQNIQAYPI